MKRAVALLLVAIFAVPSATLAQTPAVDAAKMGVSLDRIKRELVQAQQAAEQSSSDGPLKLTFTVQVVGEAPRYNLLEDFPLVGPVPYGAPTHQEVLDFLTPQEYRSPVMPISAIAGLAAKWLFERSKKQRCEEEIAEYRRLVMAGVAVAAPRCTQ